MNYLRLSLAAGVLTMVLALPAFAGWMDTGIASPLPPTASGEMDTTSTGAATGEISCLGVSADPVTDIALSLAQSMLALF